MAMFEVTVEEIETHVLKIEANSFLEAMDMAPEENFNTDTKVGYRIDIIKAEVAK